MNPALMKYVDAFAGLRVGVLGEAMLDSYLDGDSNRLCPEAPVPVVSVSGRRDAPGGAANTAVNLHALGADVSFLSVLGDDAEATMLRRGLQQYGVAADHLLIQPGRRTLSKQRICAGGRILVRFDQGDTYAIDAGSEKQLIDRLTALFDSWDALIVSDYGYGVLTLQVIAALAQLQASSPRILVADSKQWSAYRCMRPTVLKPNYVEALRILGLSDEGETNGRPERILRHEKRLLQTTGAHIVAVTLDREGAVILERDRLPYRTFAQSVSIGCSSGAGDTFLAALALALTAGADTPAAAEIATAAAAVVVAKEGTATCTTAELLNQAANRRRQPPGLPHPRLAHPAANAAGSLAAELAEHRRQGRRIVFTNGCFDILHPGHVLYLRRARELGEVLVVGVNTDAGIRRLKGPTRPINTLEDRLAVLAALRFVDYLLPFEEDTPHELIRLVRPDIFVKGGDYTRDRLPEASLVEELGGIVCILPLIEDRSTTRTIERIRGIEETSRSHALRGNEGGQGGSPMISSADWQQAENVLCVRLDVLGDVLMTTPALRALKQSRPGRRLTLLTSSAAATLAPLVPEIDACIVYDAPWMKATAPRRDGRLEFAMIERLQQQHFDAVVIFTVFSQNPLPAAFLCLMAGIPRRLAHCRENPYQLLTDWVREPEPEQFIRHEVRRQLDLVAAAGCRTANERLSLSVPVEAIRSIRTRLRELGLDSGAPWILIHPGASAPSRRYPAELFAQAAERLAIDHGLPIVFSGSAAERDLIENIRTAIAAPSHSLAGCLSLTELAALIEQAPLLITNNTGPAHIAAAVGTPVVDLYAQTNPQHTPWQVPHRLLYHDVPCKNCFKSICPQGHHDCLARVPPHSVVRAALELLPRLATLRRSVEAATLLRSVANQEET